MLKSSTSSFRILKRSRGPYTRQKQAAFEVVLAAQQQPASLSTLQLRYKELKQAGEYRGWTKEDYETRVQVSLFCLSI